MVEHVTATPSDQSVDYPRRAARITAWVYGMLVAAVLGYFLVGLPIQVSDSFGNMLKLNVSLLEL